MALEENIEKLIVAVDKLTAAYLAGGGKAAAAATSGKPATTAGTKPATTTKPKHSVEEVAAAAVSVKEKFGAPAAQALIKEFGKASKLAEIDAKNFDAFIAACEAKLAEDEGGSEDDDSL